MAFNKGPAYGLSAEVKNKVGGLFSRNAQSESNFCVSLWVWLNRITWASILLCVYRFKVVNQDWWSS